MSTSNATARTTVLPPVHIPSHGQGRLHPWQKGQSGNPNGRNLAEYHEVRRICADHSVEATWELVKLLKDDDSRVRFMAIKEIHDRGVG